MSDLIVENKTVEKFSLSDFLLEFQEAVKEGFELDLTKNETWPQKFGDHYFVVLTKSRRPRGRPEGSVVSPMTPIPEPVFLTTVPEELTPEEKAVKVPESEVKKKSGRNQSSPSKSE
jgi:hypothetical protein